MPWRLPSSEGGLTQASQNGHASPGTLPAPHSSAALTVPAEASVLGSTYMRCRSSGQTHHRLWDIQLAASVQTGGFSCSLVLQFCAPLGPMMPGQRPSHTWRMLNRPDLACSSPLSFLHCALVCYTTINLRIP